LIQHAPFGAALGTGLLQLRVYLFHRLCGAKPNRAAFIHFEKIVSWSHRDSPVLLTFRGRGICHDTLSVVGECQEQIQCVRGRTLFARFFVNIVTVAFAVIEILPLLVRP
jgi:hypothetical protein